MSDIVRLPGGKVMTRSRAQALGMLDDAGNIRADVPADSAAERILRQDTRAAEFAKRQGLAAPAPRTRRSGEDVATTADGLIKPGRKVQPLRPGNVDASGAPVTDEAVLAAIAAQTAMIEQAKADGIDLTPAQKRAATKAINAARAQALAAEVEAEEEDETEEGLDPGEEAEQNEQAESDALAEDEGDESEATTEPDGDGS